MLAPCPSPSVPLVQHLNGSELQLHHIQPLLPHHLARYNGRRRHTAAAHDRVQARPGADSSNPSAGWVVRPDMGTDGVQLQRRRRGRTRRCGRVPDRRLLRWACGVWRHRWKLPATLFEVTLGKGATADDQDYYDVSLVDGYNLPVVAVPQARQGGGSCNATGCAADLNLSCPKELQVEDGFGGGGTVARQSACEAFGQDKYCCSGAYATPATCSPTAYSSVFKSACPRAYNYAYDDGTSLFTCNTIDYTIAFCLPPTGGGTQLGAPANGESNPGDANSAPPVGSNGAGSAYQPPSAGNDGGGSAYQPPPTGNVGPGSVYQPPPTGNNGLGSVYQPPPLAGNNGAGSAYQPLPSGNNPTSNNGVGTELGSAYLPPLTGNNGVRSTYQPWKMPSSASTRYNQLWFLLPAALLFLV